MASYVNTFKRAISNNHLVRLTEADVSVNNVNVDYASQLHYRIVCSFLPVATETLSLLKMDRMIDCENEYCVDITYHSQSLFSSPGRTLPALNMLTQASAHYSQFRVGWGPCPGYRIVLVRALEVLL